MILDRLKTSIQQMKNYRHLKEVKDNAVQQEVTDKKYRDLVKQSNDFVETLQYVHSQLNFAVSDTVWLGTQILMDKLTNTASSGCADADLLADADKQYKNVCAEVKKEWKQYFSVLTSAKFGTLKVIKDINKDTVEACIADIRAAEEWYNNKEVYMNLIKAMQQADQLIQELNIGPEVVSFLKKMNMGRATVADLNDMILEWIHSEDLSGKIRLQFVIK